MSEQDVDGSDARQPGFDDVFRSHYAATVRLVHLLTGNTSSAEDVAQEAFARLHRHFATVDNPGGYLRATTVNLCRNWHRAGFRESKHLARHGAVAAATDAALGADEMLDAVDALPYRQRAVVVLRYWLDLSEADIADILDCRPGTVKSLHSRAMDRLRKVVPQ